MITSKHPNDCEWVCLCNMTGEKPNRVRRALGWVDLPGDLENPVFGNHLVVREAIHRLGYKPIALDCDDIIMGKAKLGKTMVLLHSPTSILAKHWAQLVDLSDREVVFAWGDGTEKRFTFARFRVLFSRQPSIAYQLGRRREPTSWYQRLLNFFSRLFRR